VQALNLAVKPEDVGQQASDVLVILGKEGLNNAHSLQKFNPFRH
jgi:hypothetical protein